MASCDNIHKIRVHYTYIYLGGTSNNIVLDLYAEGKTSHVTQDIEQHAEQLTGALLQQIKPAQSSVKQNTYIVSIRKKGQ